MWTSQNTPESTQTALVVHRQVLPAQVRALSHALPHLILIVKTVAKQAYTAIKSDEEVEHLAPNLRQTHCLPHLTSRRLSLHQPEGLPQIAIHPLPKGAEIGTETEEIALVAEVNPKRVKRKANQKDHPPGEKQGAEAHIILHEGRATTATNHRINPLVVTELDPRNNTNIYLKEAGLPYKLVDLVQSGEFLQVHYLCMFSFNPSCFCGGSVVCQRETFV